MRINTALSVCLASDNCTCGKRYWHLYLADVNFINACAYCRTVLFDKQMCKSLDMKTCRDLLLLEYSQTTNAEFKTEIESILLSALLGEKK